VTETPGRRISVSKLRLSASVADLNARIPSSISLEHPWVIGLRRQGLDSRHAVGVANVAAMPGFGREKETGLCHHDDTLVENPIVAGGSAARSRPEPYCRKGRSPFPDQLSRLPSRFVLGELDLGRISGHPVLGFRWDVRKRF